MTRALTLRRTLRMLVLCYLGAMGADAWAQVTENPPPTQKEPIVDGTAQTGQKRSQSPPGPGG